MEAVFWNHKKAVPPDAPVLIGIEFIIRAYVDADFAREQLTWRASTLVLVIKCSINDILENIFFCRHDMYSLMIIQMCYQHLLEDEEIHPF